MEFREQVMKMYEVEIDKAIEMENKQENITKYNFVASGAILVGASTTGAYAKLSTAVVLLVTGTGLILISLFSRAMSLSYARYAGFHDAISWVLFKAWLKRRDGAWINTEMRASPRVQQLIGRPDAEQSPATAGDQAPAKSEEQPLAGTGEQASAGTGEKASAGEPPAGAGPQTPIEEKASAGTGEPPAGAGEQASAGPAAESAEAKGAGAAQPTPHDALKRLRGKFGTTEQLVAWINTIPAILGAAMAIYALAYWPHLNPPFGAADKAQAVRSR